MHEIFTHLVLHLHTTKTSLVGHKQVDILGILLDTSRHKLLLSPKTLLFFSSLSWPFRRYTSLHQLQVPPKMFRSFAGLANSFSVAGIYSRLLWSMQGSGSTNFSTNFPAFLLPSPLSPIKVMTGPSLSYSANRQPCRLSHTWIRNLEWWTALPKNFHVGRNIWPGYSTKLVTEESMGRWAVSGTTMYPHLASSSRPRKVQKSTSSRSWWPYSPFNTSQPASATDTSASSPIFWVPSMWCPIFPPVRRYLWPRCGIF